MTHAFAVQIRALAALTLGAQADAAVGNTRDDAAEIEDAPGSGERALQLVAAHDLSHVAN
jgi:hypothetical protein